MLNTKYFHYNNIYSVRYSKILNVPIYEGQHMAIYVNAINPFVLNDFTMKK